MWVLAFALPYRQHTPAFVGKFRRIAGVTFPVDANFLRPIRRVALHRPEAVNTLRTSMPKATMYKDAKPTRLED